MKVCMSNLPLLAFSGNLSSMCFLNFSMISIFPKTTSAVETALIISHSLIASYNSGRASSLVAFILCIIFFTLSRSTPETIEFAIILKSSSIIRSIEATFVKAVVMSFLSCCDESFSILVKNSPNLP